MSLTEAYALLLVDSFSVMLLIPLKYIFIFDVMKGFGNYNPNMVCAVSAFGASLAAAANWLLGKAIKKAFNFEPESDKAIKLVTFLKKQEIILLLLSVIPFAGSVITTAHGTIGGSIIKVIPIVFIAHLIYFYIYYNFI